MMSDDDDDVIIVGEQIIVKQQQNVPDYRALEFKEGLELDQPPFFKLKAMSLLKLLPGKGWARVAAVHLYLAKCVQM
jgi:hypothetical protein